MNRKIQVRFLEGKGGVIRPTYSIQNGFWGRWSNYIYGLHGDNKELKKLVESEGEDYYRSNFHFTILEVVGSYLTDDEIIRKESKWKEKLFTREFGYNSN